MRPEMDDNAAECADADPKTDHKDDEGRGGRQKNSYRDGQFPAIWRQPSTSMNVWLTVALFERLPPVAAGPGAIRTPPLSSAWRTRPGARATTETVKSTCHCRIY